MSNESKILLPSRKPDPSLKLLSGDAAVERWGLKQAKINNMSPVRKLLAFAAALRAGPPSWVQWSAELVLFIFSVGVRWGWGAAFAAYVMWYFRAIKI